jgi:predicted DCC family thiol-disulfide oxidoreductase YuxK
MRDKADPEILNRKILFYDGECAFCHWSVKLVAAWLKPKSGVMFAPLQGTTAAQLRDEGLAVPRDLDAVCFVAGNEATLGPYAFYSIAVFFRWPMSLLVFARILPECLSWSAYRLVARNRIRLFGRAESACLIPTPEQRATQLE